MIILYLLRSPAYDFRFRFLGRAVQPCSLLILEGESVDPRKAHPSQTPNINLPYN